MIRFISVFDSPPSPSGWHVWGLLYPWGQTQEVILRAQGVTVPVPDGTVIANAFLLLANQPEPLSLGDYPGELYGVPVIACLRSWVTWDRPHARGFLVGANDPEGRQYVASL